MIVFNLLPSADKKKITKNYLILLTKDIILATLWLSSIVAIFFIIAYIFLTTDFVNIGPGALSLAKTDKMASKEIQDINSDLKTIAQIQEQNTNWTDVFLTLADLMPAEEIQITHLEINKTNNLLVLQGKALSRDTFLILKDNLEQSDMFINIESPLSNLLLAKNLNFKLEMEFVRQEN